MAIQTRPEPQAFCLTALVGGVLVADPRSGLAFRSVDGGPNLTILWPFGWSARRQLGTILLIDPKGRVTAREGDAIRAAGGYMSDPNGRDTSVSVDCSIEVNPLRGT